MARNSYNVTLHASVQNKLQALAVRTQNAKSLITRGEAELARIKDDFYGFCDASYGPNTYILYECRGDLKMHRMAREIAEPRIFDVEGMACDDRIPFETLQRFTKVVVVTDALDVELAAKRVDSRAIADHTTYGVQPKFIWTATGARSEIRPEPGQLAVVASRHMVPVLQEGAA